MIIKNSQVELYSQSQAISKHSTTTSVEKYYGLKINSEISLSEINITKRLWYICRIGKYLSLICVVILAFVLLFL